MYVPTRTHALAVAQFVDVAVPAFMRGEPLPNTADPSRGY